MRFFLSFHRTGLCRISHGDTQAAAVEDCIRTAVGTGMVSTLLDSEFCTLGRVVLRDDKYVFESEDKV